MQSGHLAEAQARTERAQAQFSDSLSAARFRVEEAKIRLYQGQSSEAVQLLTGNWAQQIADRNLAIDRLLILALANLRIGNKAKANESVSAAKALCDQLPQKQEKKGEVWSTEGTIAFEEGRLQDAQDLFQQSLENAKTTDNRFLETRSLLGLSAVSLEQYHYEDALAESQAADNIANRINAQQILITAQGNAGWAYYQMGDYARALASFDNAAASAGSLGATFDQERWLHTAGMSQAHLGDLDAARQSYDRSLILARSLKNSSEITYVDQALASLLLHASRPDAAETYINEARHLAQQTKDVSDIQFGNLLEGQLLVLRDELPESKTLLLDVERNTQQFPTTRLDAQHTLAQVCDKTGDQKQAEHWFQKSIATYRTQRSALQTDDARLPFFQNGRELYMDYVAYLIRNHRTDAALDVVNQGSAETLAEGLKIAPSKSLVSDSPSRQDLKTLARQSHAVILVYALSPQGDYLWAANGKESSFYSLPDRAKILALVASHRRALLAARDLTAEQHPAARDLYDALVKPAEHLIHPGDHVFIVADDGLHGLNFETLLTSGESSHYWIEDVTITNLASLRLLAGARPQPSARPAAADLRRLLVIGNPVYAGQQYAALPHAATEVSDVAEHFPNNARTVLTGMAATPAAYVRSEPERFNYIHFVSHAVASELVPLDSAVILSAQGSPDSAKLYARDILNRPLHADLVTISACQGSGVRAYAGEGLVGLAWAFMRAGSHNVIGALWDVSDASTPELMEHLYDGLAAGSPPDVSLRAAKVTMLHSHGVFRKPLYWGAFQLYSAGR